MSDDGRYAFVAIAFVGSVFSPRYAAARALGAADPNAHCAFNAVLYGTGGRKVWAHTERRSAHLSETAIGLGPDSMIRNGTHLHTAFATRSVPFGGRLEGTVDLFAESPLRDPIALDPAGRHRWHPVAPLAHAEVRLVAPSLSFSGAAYHDANFGLEGLEAAFDHWSWARVAHEGGTAVVYDVAARGLPETERGYWFAADGSTRALKPGARQPLPTTRWGIRRSLRARRRPTVLRTLEDTPFYARSLLGAEIGGRPALVMHETLDLERFRRRWVRFLLPFRMRWAG